MQNGGQGHDKFGLHIAGVASSYQIEQNGHTVPDKMNKRRLDMYYTRTDCCL